LKSLAPDPVYVAARHVLLDALEAAEPYRQSLILVGAQAVYLRTEGSPLALSGFTSDADIAIDARTLPPAPPIEQVLAAHGFDADPLEVGRWRRSVRIGGRDIVVPVDLMVPEAIAPGAGRRSVELAGHDHLAARRAYGLEAALVNNGPMRINALDPGDRRSVTTRVAGAGALLVAKVHKISERVRGGRHLRTPVDKDAGDIFRLMQATSVAEMASAIRLAIDSEVSQSATESALSTLSTLFGRRTALGVEMTVRALGPAGEARETTEVAMVSYVAALLSAL
jgi:hypothetical protein